MNFKLLSIAFFTMIFISSCKKDEVVDESPVTTVKIAGLFSITGNGSTMGVNSREAMNLAIADVNQYLEQRGSKYRFSGMVYDTQLDTTLTKTQFETARSNGARFILGPQTSAECRAILPSANDNQVMVISQNSTASSLSIPNDALFRMCPGDGPEGQAISRTMYNSGKRMMITLSRNDVGNLGLQISVNSKFTSLGGQIDSLAPYATNITDFTPIIQQLRTKIQQYTNTFGSSQVGVYIASFDECVLLFNQAVNDTILNSVNWYGGDGVVQSTALLNDANARDFAIATGFFAPTFGLPAAANPNLTTVQSAIQNATGLVPDAVVLSVYDAVWLIARTVASYEGVLNDFGKLKSDFLNEANQYFGITGPTVLNSSGDRALGSFDYYGIVNQNGVYSWQVVGTSN
ncbi:MAG: hypothetical protein RL090_1955 [Bacteroidota bacterium]